jgi:hypothetical protein
VILTDPLLQERATELWAKIANECDYDATIEIIFRELAAVRDQTNRAHATRLNVHTAPDRDAITENVANEPEGERIRAELEDFLKRNNIVAITLDTDEHVIEIDIVKLPSRTKSVLTKWGAIRINDSAVSPELSPVQPVCKEFCGYLGWTVEKLGRVTHKHSCPQRTDKFCQSHPKNCPTQFDKEKP